MPRTADNLGMGHRIRQWKLDTVYESVQGIVDRQDMFAPDDQPGQPLLSRTCRSDALDMSNDHIPIPSTYNIIGAAIGRALRDVPVKLHWFEFNLNHPHSGFSVDESCCIGRHRCEMAGKPECGLENHFSRFRRRVNSVIATQINKKYLREGHLFASRARVTPCKKDEDAERQLIYAMTNPVKDGLVEKVADSPLFSTHDYWLRGKKLRFWFIDWKAYDLAGGDRNKSHRAKDYIRWVEWEPTVLPSFANKPRSDYQAFIREGCRSIEAEQRNARMLNRSTVMGREALYKIDPRGRPSTPRYSGPQPLVHASSKAERDAFACDWKSYIHQHRIASWDYRMGDHLREFPNGSVRPRLVTVYSASRL